MHARDLLELAALVAVHSPALVHSGCPIPAPCVTQYWTASRCRLERWSRSLRRYSPVTTASELETARNWTRLRPLLEEILASELLTRLWTATAAAYDRRTGEAEIEPPARSIYVSHLEVRNRALDILVHAPGIDLAEAVALNRLRRRIERWCDLLLAHLSPNIDIAEFAFENPRAQDFADDLYRDRSPAVVDLTWQLVLAALRASFASCFADRSPNADLNQQIGSSILALFPSEQFDSLGLPKSLWLQRLSRTASDTQGMLDDLFALDDPAPTIALRQRF